MSEEAKVLIVDDRGEWGKDIRKNLPDVLFEGEKESCRLVVSGCDKEIADPERPFVASREQDYAFIVSPATRHSAAYESLLRKKIKSKTLLVEKPNNLDEISRIEHFNDRQEYSAYCAEDIYFIDHYLFKQGVADAGCRIKENADQLREVAVYICETEDEMRGWMRDGKTGGVITDLAHHAVAILNCLLNPQWESVLGPETDEPAPEQEGATPWSSLKLEKYTTFNRNFAAAENYVDFSGNLGGVAVRIVVGKQCAVDRKCIALTFEGERVYTR